MKSSLLTLNNIGTNYFDKNRLNFGNNIVKKGYIPLIRFQQTTSLANSRINDAYPDYLGILNNDQNRLDNLTLAFNRSTTFTNLIIDIRYNETELFNFTFYQSYSLFGYFQAYVFSSFSGNNIGLNRNKILIQNADSYPFKSINYLLLLLLYDNLYFQFNL